MAYDNIERIIYNNNNIDSRFESYHICIFSVEFNSCRLLLESASSCQCWQVSIKSYVFCSLDIAESDSILTG